MGNLVSMLLDVYVHVTVYVFMCRHVYMIVSCKFIRAYIAFVCTL